MDIKERYSTDETLNNLSMDDPKWRDEELDWNKAADEFEAKYNSKLTTRRF